MHVGLESTRVGVGKGALALWTLRPRSCNLFILCEYRRLVCI